MVRKQTRRVGWFRGVKKNCASDFMRQECCWREFRNNSGEGVWYDELRFCPWSLVLGQLSFVGFRFSVGFDAWVHCMVHGTYGNHRNHGPEDLSGHLCVSSVVAGSKFSADGIVYGRTREQRTQRAQLVMTEFGNGRGSARGLA